MCMIAQNEKSPCAIRSLTLKEYAYILYHNLIHNIISLNIRAVKLYADNENRVRRMNLISCIPTHF